MEVRISSQVAPGRDVNEDAALSIGTLVAVFDGVTQPPGFDTGCVHGPAWYVRRLSAQLAAAFSAAPLDPLPELLAAAIQGVADAHRNTCDLTRPGTPASTVCLLRAGGAQADYLVLCDSPLVLDRGDRAEVVTDDRFGRLIAELRNKALVPSAAGLGQIPGVTVEKWQHTNRPGGYWIAAAAPQAAFEAVTGSVPLTGPQRLRRAALLTDGASAAVDKFALFGWDDLLDLLVASGPGQLIRRVRRAEKADQPGSTLSRYKKYDDATAAICLFEGTDL
ncbi:hypothetical protein [Actinoplanes couchii]|uniref:PPM-type phosphatase domain-containing protein n=1 Tax=Actinoplanes couchii TaxID=403638 RepID=A0ABQ3X3E9_9ACTN|nr:hypothetical protein [Actinoplanes couchii]MDR6322795.1 hypothetical protein [Actinoplanes couchii]GID53034.1 hypothetical protein Aco03nite_014380 [Actinoplanes couchii]